MRVVYIAGTSHSGSTLLDLMLNAHPAVIAVGEVLKLNRQLRFKNAKKQTHSPCACGAPSLWQCPFWSAVDAHTRQSIGKSLAELDMLDYGERDAARAPNAVVLQAVAAVAGKPFVVDSSKLPKRLSHLLKLKELDVYPIHLVRDPKGQIYSVLRKHGGFVKHILRYQLIHEQIRRMLKSVPHSVVHYEDLVLAPERTLRGLLQPLGLDFDRRQLAWAEAEKHQVAGNHVRFDAKSTLVLDDAWRGSLSGLQRLAIDIGTFPARRSTQRARQAP